MKKIILIILTLTLLIGCSESEIQKSDETSIHRSNETLLCMISDTHDDLINTIKSIEIFKNKKCDLVIHSGDITSPSTIKLFKGLNIRFIKGNADREDITLYETKAKEIGSEFFDETYEFAYRNKKFIVYHGYDTDKMNEIINSGKYDYVLRGHTSKTIDKRIGKTRIINPGSPRDTKTIAILEVTNDKLEFIKIS